MWGFFSEIRQFHVLSADRETLNKQGAISSNHPTVR